MVIIGIDPSVKPAVCFYAPNKPQNKLIYHLCKDLYDFNQFFEASCSQIKRMYPNEKEYYCYIEKVHSMPRDGVKSAFSFGQAFGFIEAVVYNSKIPYFFADSRKWKKQFGLINKEKADSIKKAKTFYPSESFMEKRMKVPNHNIAEAFLIARFGYEDQIDDIE